MRWSTLTRLAACCALALFLVVPAFAQEGEMEHGEMSAEQMEMMKAFEASMTPGSQHQLLADTTGSYKLTVKSYWENPAEPQVSHGTADREMILGGRVLEEKVTSDMMGQTFHGVGYTGYDNVTGQYWATWMDSMGTGVTMMHGTLSDDGKKASFEGKTSDPMSGGKVTMRIESQTADDGTETHDFYMPGPGGEEMKGMTIVYEPAE